MVTVFGEMPLSVFGEMLLSLDHHLMSILQTYKGPLPCASYGSFKMFKISASDFRTVGMHRRKQACTDKFLATLTEHLVHGIYKVVTQSSFSVIG